MKTYRVKGICVVDDKQIEVNEVEITNNKEQAQDRILTMVIRLNGHSGYWLKEPEVKHDKSD